MGYHSDDVYGACDCCLHARQTRNGYWYCTCHEDDYFPDADWEDEGSVCPSYDPDPDCFDDDDDDDFDPNESVECPMCGDDANWNGSEYECTNDDCGWCGFPDE